MKKSFKVRTKKDTVTLTDKEYKAAGGQGAVFCKGKLAYKIYHDPKKVIPVAKICELAELKRDNILAPIEPLYEYKTNTPIGFTMKYIQAVEFLCKIFTKTFRDDKGVNPSDIAYLVTEMQKTLQYIHKMGILVVDYNEMNFLFDKDIKNIFHIDVDSWQTKNFPADAIMDSIRDRTVRAGKFTELSDWFSWAVVTFQMYIGIHPYKGRHKDFKPAEWGKRMDLGVSVFDPDVKLPGVCQDFSVIPKKHLDWYKAVFLNNERSIPPLADAVMVATAIVKAIGSKGDFIVRQIFETKKPIKNVFFFNGSRYVMTSEGIYDNQKNKVFTFKEYTKSDLKGMCDVFGEDPLVVCLKNNKAEFYDLKETLISSIRAEDMMGYNGAIYTINNGQLIENTFERFGKIIHRTKIVCEISRSYKIFRGVIIQDDFMKCRLAIPFESGKCINIHIEPLDGQRIVDARYDKGICIILAEKQGKYSKYILCFNEAHSNYTIREEDVVDFHSINFIVLPNKLCLLIDDEKLSMFKDNKSRKEITNLPFDVSMRLYHDNMQVLFVDGKKLYSVTMK